MSIPRRFDLDLVVNTFHALFALPSLVILPAAALFLANRGQPFDAMLQQASKVCTWHELVCVKHKWISWVMIFIVIKAIGRYLGRRAENNGVMERDPPNWSKEVIAITGGATGIGQSTVELLSKKYKARIAVLDVADPQYEKAAPDAPPILWIHTDVTKPEAIAAAHEKIKEVFGTSPSVVIGCAGIAVGGPILTTSSALVQKTFDINALQHVRLAKEFVPFMAKNNHGHYITVASSASFYTPPLLSAYCMSKGAALAFHEELRVELRVAYNAPRVRTSVVTPTKVRTLLGHAMNDAENSFVDPTLEPIEVASAIVNAIAEGRSHTISQPVITKLLPFVRAMPEWFRTIVAKLGETDSSLTTDSIRAAIKAGYGKNLGAENYESVLQGLDPSYTSKTA
ncbi:hypothetical protein MVES1_001628 [Malassezia vespertilionis]|uniref:NAD(P)-binding protein n=1 Tax=Malassezia vespertilionis TaxID=2020962 RepID=A0A2N1JCQ0_9BASI|nr:uncharacterized protein MVES1_001628 [Malassezia vespertilionis]PKI84313.1 hypothetical protein MVES_001530 [Malassezia vespertilionis]WFD06283.1 hypothetical protein MVES1_001628 [Malassezia vespertilionis]